MKLLTKCILPEGNDLRILAAARSLVDAGLCHPILVGDVDEISNSLGSNQGYTVFPVDTAFENVVQQGASLLTSGAGDCMVAGAAHNTAVVIKATIKQVGLQAGVKRLSSCFLFTKGDEKLFFTDCAVSIAPSQEELVASAVFTSALAQQLGVSPKVAFISYATHNSATGESVELVAAAAKSFAGIHPGIPSDGPLQYDVARSPKKAQDKGVSGDIVGDANVLVFKDLDVANPVYKALEIDGGFQAIGPLLLGAAKPVNDLSRGCSAEDVVEVVKIALLQAA